MVDPALMEASRRRLAALAGADAAARSLGDTWWQVLDGVKLQLRAGPGLDCAAIEGRFLAARAPFRVLEVRACAAQTWLRLRGDRWAFAFNRRTGARVAARVAPAEALALAAEKLARADPARALEAALLATLAAPRGAGAPVVARLRRLYDARGWAPAERKGTRGLLVALAPETIDALRAKGDSGGDPPYEFAVDRRRGRKPTAKAFDLAGSEALPAAARPLLEAGVACVLRGGRLFPAAQAKWGDAAYLRRELGPQPCQVLSVPKSYRKFCYTRSRVKGPLDAPEGAYKFDAHVTPPPKGFVAPEFAGMTFDEFLRGRADRCLYLQQPVCQPTGDGTMRLPDRIGDEMRADVDGLNHGFIRRLYDTCNLGPWAMMQLFVGSGSMAPRARTTLHYDQVDNFYLQVAGKKTFRLFDPSQTAELSPYPFHHELDRRSEVDLDADDLAAAFPRAHAARMLEVTLGPGDLLFLPCWWWHEVCTDYDAAARPDELTVSLSFWFDIQHRMVEPPFPLQANLRSELARQLEIALAEWLHDSRLVRPFLRSLRTQLLALDGFREPASRGRAAACVDAAAGLDGDGGGGGGGGAWPLHGAARPAGVAEARWAHLFEFVAFKLVLLLCDHGVLRWMRETREYPLD